MLHVKTAGHVSVVSYMSALGVTVCMHTVSYDGQSKVEGPPVPTAAYMRIPDLLINGTPATA